jgi:hypothetical protein
MTAVALDRAQGRPSEWLQTQIICAGQLEARPFFFFNFKGTPSKEEHKTIFSGLKICKMALFNQIDSPAFFSLTNVMFRKLTFRN